MYNELGISEKTLKLVNEAEKDCYELFKKIDEASCMNSLKVLNAFHKNNVSESCFNSKNARSTLLIIITGRISSCRA